MNKNQVDNFIGKNVTVITNDGTGTLVGTLHKSSTPASVVRVYKDGDNFSSIGYIHIAAISETVSVRDAIVAAIKTSSKIEIDYTSDAWVKTTRVITPTALTINAEGEKVTATCHLRNNVRSFVIDRIAATREPKPPVNPYLSIKRGDRIVVQGFDDTYIVMESNPHVSLVNSKTGTTFAGVGKGAIADVLEKQLHSYTFNVSEF